MNTTKSEKPTACAKIQERKRRIVEHHWKGANKIMRGQFKVCEMKRVHDKRIAADPLHAVFLPTPLQALRICKGLSPNPDDRKAEI
jgi:hypothetical protein